MRLPTMPHGCQVGVDAAPDPGLRGPTNFHGLLDAAILDVLDRTLKDAQADLRCGPTVVHGLFVAAPPLNDPAGAFSVFTSGICL